MSPAAATPSPRRLLVMVVVSIALLMASIDHTIVATALPDLQRDLDAPLNWSSWTITVYALAQVVAMPVAGRLSDQYGRRTVFLSAVAIFTAASLACGLANDIVLLVVLRAIQALGGGAFLPSATGMVVDAFGRDRDRAVGLFTSILPIGGLVGPVLGGVLTTYWSWRGIFLINVPLGVVLLVLGLKLLPSSGSRRAQRLDPFGMALLTCGLLAAMVGISALADGRSRWPLVAGSLAAATLSAGLLVRHARRDENAVIPIALLRGRGFGTVHALTFASGAATLGFTALIPLYAHNRYELSALSGGTLLTARAIGTIAVAGATAFLLRRIGCRRPMALGFAMIAVGLVLTALEPAFGLTPYAWLSIASAVTGVGMGMSIPATNNAVLHLAPDRSAAISGIRGMFRQIGGITAISVTTAVAAGAGDPGQVQAAVFLVFAVVLVLLIPVVRWIPDPRGAW